MRDLGLKTDWNGLFKVWALSASEANVSKLAFKDVMQLLSYLECFSKEKSFFVLTLAGVSRSSASCCIPSISRCTFHRPFLSLGTPGAYTPEIYFGRSIGLRTYSSTYDAYLVYA